MRKSLKLKRKINELKEELFSLGDMRPGSLTKQVRKWGKEYWQISYTHRGRGHTGYVSDKNYEKVKMEIENYRRLKELSKELIDLSIEYAKITDSENA